MATILVRDLPDTVHQHLAAMAAERRMSVNSLVITLLEECTAEATAEPAPKPVRNRGRRYPDA